jgi:hypothetical protein
VIVAVIAMCVSASGAVYRTTCDTVAFPEEFGRFEECLLFVDDFVRDSHGKVSITNAGCHRRHGFEQ